MLKDLKQGTQVKLSKLSKKEHKTTPAPRYTEPALIKKLSELGIGRPSTFASIVSVIQERGYVVKKNNQLVPTFLGFAVVGLLTNKLSKYVDYEYTSQMEEALEEVENGTTTRLQFLNNFWNGSSGFDKTMEKLKTKIDWDEIKKTSTIDLHNGYTVNFNKNGAWLQDAAADKNENGYIPSVRLDDTDTVDDVFDSSVCKELFINKKNQKGPRELGMLETGVYSGWLVTLRDGKYGPYIQATKDKNKPINHKVPETLDVNDVTLENISFLFNEIKLPRNISDNFFTGIGKKGPWVGYKANSRSRKPTFFSLPEIFDPRTVTLAEVEELWKTEKEKKAKNNKNAKPAAKPKTTRRSNKK